MNSCLYECRIMHDRHSPKRYRFVHDMFMFYLDLEELKDLPQQSWLFGFNQARVYNFRWDDHIANIRSYLQKQGVNDQVVRITLLTNLRTFGYIFNPVSFYFCFDQNKKPVCVVTEIGNTFGELKLFYLGADKLQNQRFEDQQTKYYYISPFIELDNTLDFHIQIPEKDFFIAINVLKNEEKFFYSSMHGRQKEFSTQNLLWYTLKFPFVTLKVIFLIHWHAAILFLVKKLGYHAKEANPQLQREVYREWVKR